MKKPFLIVAFILIVGCQNSNVCNTFVGNSFEGQGIIFYHRPVTGDLYHLYFVPVCENPKQIIEQLNRKSFDVTAGAGISFNLIGSSSPVLQLKKFSKNLSLLNRKNLAREYQTVFVCPAYLSCSNVENLSVRRTFPDSTISADYEFDKGKFSFRYFFAGRIQIDKFYVLTDTTYSEKRL
jgi:hypothetical protein